MNLGSGPELRDVIVVRRSSWPGFVAAVTGADRQFLSVRTVPLAMVNQRPG